MFNELRSRWTLHKTYRLGRWIPTTALKRQKHPDNDGSLVDYGLQLLGSPIGTEEFQIKHLGEKIKTINEQSQKLIQLEDNQIKFLLLTQCFNTKVNHLLRTVPPSLTIKHLLKPFNKILRNIVTSIRDVHDITENQWQQSVLRWSQHFMS